MPEAESGIISVFSQSRCTTPLETGMFSSIVIVRVLTLHQIDITTIVFNIAHEHQVVCRMIHRASIAASVDSTCQHPSDCPMPVYVTSCAQLCRTSHSDTRVRQALMRQFSKLRETGH